MQIISKIEAFDERVKAGIPVSPGGKLTVFKALG
jgi:hypothetical protein